MKKLTTKGRSDKNDLQLDLSLSDSDNSLLGCPHQASHIHTNAVSGPVSSDCVFGGVCILSIKNSNETHLESITPSNSNRAVLFSLENVKLEKQKNKRRELAKRVLAYAEKLSW